MDKILKSDKLSRYIKIFLINMLAMFLMVALPKLGIKIISQQAGIHGIISPLSVKKEDILNKLMPNLEQKINNFSLKNPSSLVPVSNVQAAEDYQNANGYAVVDFDSGEVLAEKNLSQQTSIASVTKVMSAVTALDLMQPNELITISEKAAAEPATKIGVVAGQKMTLEELLHAMLLTSANDAAQAVADGVDDKYGQKGLFIEAMNAKAKSMGLKHTHFSNPMGLDGADHYSTAEDVAIFTHYALSEYPLIAGIVKKDYQFLPADNNHKQFDLYNWNGLLGVYPGAVGVKIGNTGDAGYTTSVVAERNGQKLIVVLLGAPGVLERDLWAASLLDLGFGKKGISAANIDQTQLKTKYSTWKYFN